jgi:hypothetical protein
MKKYRIISNSFHTPYELVIISNPDGIDDKFIGKLVFWQFLKKGELVLKDKTFKDRYEKGVIDGVKAFFEAKTEEIIIIPYVPITVLRSINIRLTFKKKKVFSGKIVYIRPSYDGYKSENGDIIDDKIIEAIRSESNFGEIQVEVSKHKSKVALNSTDLINFMQQNRAKFYRPIYITCYCYDFEYLRTLDPSLKSINNTIELGLHVQSDVSELKEINSLFKVNFGMDITRHEYLLLYEFGKVNFV